MISFHGAGASFFVQKNFTKVPFLLTSRESVCIVFSKVPYNLFLEEYMFISYNRHTSQGCRHDHGQGHGRSRSPRHRSRVKRGGYRSPIGEFLFTFFTRSRSRDMASSEAQALEMRLPSMEQQCCRLCRNNCPLDSPGCDKGAALAKKQTNR